MTYIALCNIHNRPHLFSCCVLDNYSQSAKAMYVTNIRFCQQEFSEYQTVDKSSNTKCNVPFSESFRIVI